MSQNQPGQARSVGGPSIGLRRNSIVSLGLLALAACTGRPQDADLATPSPESTAADDSTATPEAASATVVLFETSESASATTTPMPDNVYALDAGPWPIEGSLLGVDGDNPEFGVDIIGLGTGSYLLLADEDTRVASIYSFNTGETAELLRPDAAEWRPDQFAVDDGVFMLGSEERAGYWRLYDLRERASWTLGPTCRGAWKDWLSPDGGWIGSICYDAFQIETAAYDHVAILFVSTRTGTGTLFAVPSNGSTRERPHLQWIGDGKPLISGVWINGKERACVISIEQETMYCPPLGLATMDHFRDYSSPRAPLLAFVDFEFSPRAVLVPRECFEMGGDCPGVQELQPEQASLIITTPNLEIIWWIEPLGPDPTTEIGVVELTTGKLIQLASLGGDYSYRAGCPDGSCLFIFQYDSEINWRLNLDGGLQVMPFRGDVIIGSFRVP